MSSLWPYLPLVAALANAAAFLSAFSQKDLFARGFRVLTILLIGGNLSLYAVLESESQTSAYAMFHIFRHFAFLAAPVLAVLCRILSGRNFDSAMTRILAGGAVLLIGAIQFDYFSGQPVLVESWVRHDWGYFPVLAMKARVLVGGLFAVSALSSVYWISKPVERLAARPAPWLVLFWWMGFAGNFPALAGASVYPVGMIFETIASVLISSSLRREIPSGLLQRSAEVLASTALALSTGLVLSAAVPDMRWKIILVSAAAGMAALIGADRLRPQAPAARKSDLSQFGLTKQEERICELIMEGYTRRQIGFFLGIADGTLRNHLVNLYTKTVDREKGPPVRDKFQRLTLILLEMKNRDTRHGSNEQP